jgi:hypothetical protein
MSKAEILVTSPAFWSIVCVFVFNGLQAIVPLLSGTGQNVVNVALLLMTAYLHAGTVQNAQGIH